MNERPSAKDPFERLGFSVTADEDGGKRLVFRGKVLKLSKLDAQNERGIRIVLPDGKEKIYEGVFRYTIQAKKFVLEDLNL